MIKAPQRQQVMVQAVTYKMQHTLLRVLIHKSTNSLSPLEQTGMMLTEEMECRTVKDGMLFIPNMARAMPAEPLLTWDVVMPPLHDGQLRRKRSTRLIFLADAGSCRWRLPWMGRCGGLGLRPYEKAQASEGMWL